MHVSKDPRQLKYLYIKNERIFAREHSKLFGPHRGAASAWSCVAAPAAASSSAAAVRVAPLCQPWKKQNHHARPAVVFSKDALQPRCRRDADAAQPAEVFVSARTATLQRAYASVQAEFPSPIPRRRRPGPAGKPLRRTADAEFVWFLVDLCARRRKLVGRQLRCGVTSAYSLQLRFTPRGRRLSTGRALRPAGDVRRRRRRRVGAAPPHF